MDLTFSLMVLFLLYLKGRTHSFIHSLVFILFLCKTSSATKLLWLSTKCNFISVNFLLVNCKCFPFLTHFLICVSGLFAQNDTVVFNPGSVCAPAGSTVALESTCLLYPGWTFKSWKLRINNTETLADPSKDSRYRYSRYKNVFDWWCYLLIHGLKETDAGTYYMSFISRIGDVNYTLNSQSKFTVHVTGKYYSTPWFIFTWYESSIYILERYKSDI